MDEPQGLAGQPGQPMSELQVQETLSLKEGKHRLRKAGDVGLQPAHA